MLSFLLHPRAATFVTLGAGLLLAAACASTSRTDELPAGAGRPGATGGAGHAGSSSSESGRGGASSGATGGGQGGSKSSAGAGNTAGSVTAGGGRAVQAGGTGPAEDGGESSSGGSDAGGAGASGTGGTSGRSGTGGMSGRAGTGGSSGMAGGGGALTGSSANDGVWEGTTADGTALRLLVTGGQIRFITVTWGEDAAPCWVGTRSVSLRDPELSIGDAGQLTGTLALVVHAYATCDTTGVFDGDTGSGSLACKIQQGDCVDDTTTAFSVARVLAPPVCGNGSVDWPEQCDDADTSSDDGCSSSCLLEGTAEEEPNDDGATAVAEDDFYGTPDGLTLINADVLVAASISPAGDEDMIRVFGTSSTATTAVRIETFGRDGPGTCDTDTVLDVRLPGGAILATDDDGGVGTCSSLTYDIPATFPISALNVHITEKGDDAAIGLYFVAVTYL